MDILIHILEGFLIVGLAASLVIVYMISEDLRKIAYRLSERLEEMERQKRAEERYREEIKASNERMLEKIREGVDKWIQDKNKLNVKDSPLDFPPTKKED